MHREDFYERGIYQSERLGAHLGWVSQKGSYSEGMPVFNRTKDAILIFDGEHFPTGEAGLHAGNGNSSLAAGARSLMELYEENKERFFELLNGWFAGVLIDLRIHKVFLFNDRYGMRKVYYHEGEDAFLFASEAKALLAVRSELREFDPVGLGQYLGCCCTLGERTLFKGISRLPAGVMWTWSGRSRVSKKHYFEPKSWEQLPPLDPHHFYEKFDDTFAKVLPRYFDSDEVAMSLTAGLDTRLLMACLPCEPGSLPCFTFGGPSRETLDIKRAREVAQVCRQPHQVIRLQEDFFRGFPELAADTIRISDGALDVCCSHDLYFNRLARGIAPIRMTGKFGSEIVRDRSMFKPSPLRHELVSHELREYITGAVGQLDEVRRGHPLTMSAFKELPWNEHGKLSIEQSQLTLRTPYMDNELVRLFYQAPAEVRSGNQAQLRLIQRRSPALAKILTNRGTAGSSNGFVSRCSQLYYYSLLKADYMYLYAMPSWMTRLTSRGPFAALERLFLGHQKFEHYRLWLRKELAPFVKEVLLDSRTLGRSFFNRRFIEQIVIGHTVRGDNYFYEINKALTLELICRQLFEGYPQASAARLVPQAA
jgi:asparagine synthase (glutamine-hydrolysing)